MFQKSREKATRKNEITELQAWRNFTMDNMETAVPINHCVPWLSDFTS